MKRFMPGWMALLLVAGLYGISLSPAHAEGACDPGDRLVDSRILTEGGKQFRKDTCVHAPGPWSQGEFDHVAGILKALPDTPARTWVKDNVTFVRVQEKAQPPICVIGKDGVQRCPDATSRRMPSPWAGLHDDQAALFFNDRFFKETAPVQQSLVAFECGKALFKKLELESWFNRNLVDDSAAIGEMLAAGKAPGEPNADFADASSQFGGLFRAAMLQIPTRGHPGWNEPLRKLDAMLRKITTAP